MFLIWIPPHQLWVVLETGPSECCHIMHCIHPAYLRSKHKPATKNLRMYSGSIQYHHNEHLNNPKTADEPSNKLRVPNQKGISLLYIMLEIHHSDREPSKCCALHVLPSFYVPVSVFCCYHNTFYASFIYPLERYLWTRHKGYIIWLIAS